VFLADEMLKSFAASCHGPFGKGQLLPESHLRSLRAESTFRESFLACTTRSLHEEALYEVSDR